MARVRVAQNKRKMTIVIVVLAVLVLAIILIAVLHGNGAKKTAVSTDTTAQVAANKNTTTETDTSGSNAATTTKAQTVDPSTLSSIAIQPLGITVFYTKGTPGFSYIIKKTADNTQYVEFTSPDLVGTKCTDDEGLIASIVKNPTSSEDQTTISQTVKIGSDSYGLSLASPGCTANADLLSQYQAGFKNGFSNLAAL